VKFRRTPAPVMAVAATLLTLSSCGNSDTVSDQKSFSFGGNRLVIDAPSSDLQVVPGSGSGIQVRRWLSGTAAKPEHSSWTLDGDTLKLRVDCSGLVFECGQRFQVAVPPDVPVVVNSGDGNNTASGLSGSVIIKSGSGQVKVSNISGPLKISTREGNVTASDIRSPTVRVTSKDGNVTIGFAAAPQLVDIASTVGNITARVPIAGHRYRVSVTSGTGDARSGVPNDSRSGNVVKLSSRAGNVTVLPDTRAPS
jgi:hypothetical protein